VLVPLTVGDVVEITGPLLLTGERPSRLSERPERHRPRPGETFRISTLDLVDAYVVSTSRPRTVHGAISRFHLTPAST